MQPTLPPTAATPLATPLATEESYLRAGDDRATGTTEAVLTFVAGGETFGLPIGVIREIIKLREITEVPRAPHFVLGIITVRGMVIPVLDLRRRLSLEPTPPTRAARVLVTSHEGEPFGLLVDAVTGVVRLLPTEIEPPPSALTTGDQHFLTGIARSGAATAGRRARLIVLLDLGAVVSFSVKQKAGPASTVPSRRGA
jgi:purine-binding chemotaxis protein CheW